MSNKIGRNRAFYKTVASRDRDARKGTGSMRVIQAGVGGFGGSWLYAVRECGGFSHVALVDPNLEALRAAGEITGVPPTRQFARLEDALEKVEADGLLNVTPAPVHKATTIAAI